MTLTKPGGRDTMKTIVTGELNGGDRCYDVNEAPCKHARQACGRSSSGNYEKTNFAKFN